MQILAVLAGLFAIVLVYRSAASAAAVVWPLVTLAARALVVVALAFWHRRRMAELHEKHAVLLGRYRRLGVQPWPQACRDCGSTVHDWKASRVHDDPAVSPCAAMLQAAERASSVPAEVPWTAVVEAGREEAGND